MAGIHAEHAQHDATLRTMALGTLILNAFSVRTAPGRLIRCRGSAIQNNVQTNTYDPRRPGATPSLLSSRPDFCRATRCQQRSKSAFEQPLHKFHCDIWGQLLGGLCDRPVSLRRRNGGENARKKAAVPFSIRCCGDKRRQAFQRSEIRLAQIGRNRGGCLLPADLDPCRKVKETGIGLARCD